MNKQQQQHIFGPISSILFGLSVDALSTIAFCVDYPVHLSIEGTSVVKTDSEWWAVFLGRRIVLPFLEVSSPDCNQNRIGLVRAGRQRMLVVAGSEGATDESTPDCSHCTLPYYSDSVLSCAYNQLVTLCSRVNQEQTQQNEHPSCRYPGNGD